MPFLDLVSLISGIISIIGFGMTVATLIKANKIDKAVKQSKAEVINKYKFMAHYDEYCSKLKTLSSKVNRVSSSGEISNVFNDMYSVIISLCECCDHMTDEHKDKIKSCRSFIQGTQTTSHIYDNNDCIELRKYIIEILNIISQEEYRL